MGNDWKVKGARRGKGEKLGKQKKMGKGGRIKRRKKSNNDLEKMKENIIERLRN